MWVKAERWRFGHVSDSCLRVLEDVLGLVKVVYQTIWSRLCSREKLKTYLDWSFRLLVMCYIICGRSTYRVYQLVRYVSCHIHADWTMPPLCMALKYCIRKKISLDKNFANPRYLCIAEIFGGIYFRQCDKGRHIPNWQKFSPGKKLCVYGIKIWKFSCGQQVMMELITLHLAYACWVDTCMLLSVPFDLHILLRWEIHVCI